eukprot:365633-Chlamydomonas_euryale.AAC.6
MCTVIFFSTSRLCFFSEASSTSGATDASSSLNRRDTAFSHARASGDARRQRTAADACGRFGVWRCGVAGRWRLLEAVQYCFSHAHPGQRQQEI